MQFYGQPHEYSVRASCVLLGDEVVGVAGVARHPEWGMFFTDNSRLLQPHLSSVTVWRAIKDAMTIVREYHGPVMSIADHAEGCRNLARLGFTHLYGAWWGWRSSQQ